LTTWTVIPGSRGLTIGPKLELKLPGNFSLEANALHRALHSTTEFPVISPAIRYTRWGEPRSTQGEGTYRNEVEALAGFAL
jgi:hypothetical protein